MDIQDILEKYRVLKPAQRLGLLIGLGFLPAAMTWVNEGDSLAVRKEQVDADHASAQAAFEDARKKVAELPALETRVAEIEGELSKAREVLPDKLELDAILGFIGTLEQELKVKLVKFVPGKEQDGEPGLDYRELPVELAVRGSFGDTMRFMDRLVHMQNLTHMRNIQFQARELPEKEGADPNKAELQTGPRPMESTAKLILFKGK